MTKSSDPICDLFKAQASRPYSNTGTHLTFIRHKGRQTNKTISYVGNLILNFDVS